MSMAINSVVSPVVQPVSVQHAATPVRFGSISQLAKESAEASFRTAIYEEFRPQILEAIDPQGSKTLLSNLRKAIEEYEDRPFFQKLVQALGLAKNPGKQAIQIGRQQVDVRLSQAGIAGPTLLLEGSKYVVLVTLRSDVAGDVVDKIPQEFKGAKVVISQDRTEA